jgi:hypothetical protein
MNQAFTAQCPWPSITASQGHRTAGIAPPTQTRRRDCRSKVKQQTILQKAKKGVLQRMEWRATWTIWHQKTTPPVNVARAKSGGGKCCPIFSPRTMWRRNPGIPWAKQYPQPPSCMNRLAECRVLLPMSFNTHTLECRRIPSSRTEVFLIRILACVLVYSSSKRERSNRSKAEIQWTSANLEATKNPSTCRSWVAVKGSTLIPLRNQQTDGDTRRADQIFKRRWLVVVGRNTVAVSYNARHNGRLNQTPQVRFLNGLMRKSDW